MKIFSGSSSQRLTEQICKVLNNEEIKPGKLKIDKFSDGEILPLFQESVRDEDVFFVQTTNSSDNIMETLLVIDAAKRAGCKSFKFRYLPSISDHAIHRVRAHEMIEIPRSSPTKWIIKTRDIWFLLEFQPQILLNQ